MSEGYVPVAELTTYDDLLEELEVTTDAAESFTDDLEDAVEGAENHKDTAEAIIDGKFNILFLVGA